MTRLGFVCTAVVVVVLAGCIPSTDRPIGPVPDGEMSITAVNQTDRPLELVVNGRPIAQVQPGSQTFDAGRLPPLPWFAELRLVTGRSLLTLPVGSGSVTIVANGSNSPGIRADLSCGRIELWVMFPLIGPAPGPGRPGDCDP